jgi:arylsulfatase A-like enzyme
MQNRDTHPNILIITCHDLGRFVSCYGVATVQTPNLDRFAAEGVRFDQAYCTAPQCSPSRASLFTGLYPHQNGVMGLTHAGFAWDLLPDVRHIGQRLHEHGYQTVMMGVHHESRAGDHEEVARRCAMDEVVPPMPGEDLADEAITRLHRLAQADRPFYLQIGFHEPHRVARPGDDTPDFMGFTSDYIEPDGSRGVGVPPWIVDEPSAREEMAELQGAMRYVDAAIGRVIDGVDQLGLRENTLVIVTTDHGLALPRAKCTLYDPGIGVMLLLRLPSRGWQGGSVIDSLVSNVDVVPTIVDLLELPGSDGLAGRSIAPLLDGTARDIREDIFAEMTYHDYYDPMRAVRTSRHKLIVFFTTSPAIMNPTQSWRPRTRPIAPANPATEFHPLVELYDLAADPLEAHNLADDPQHAATRRDLLTRLHTWMRATNDPLLDGAVTSPRHREAVDALSAP